MNKKVYRKFALAEKSSDSRRPNWSGHLLESHTEEKQESVRKPAIAAANKLLE